MTRCDMNSRLSIEIIERVTIIVSFPSKRVKDNTTGVSQHLKFLPIIKCRLKPKQKP